LLPGQVTLQALLLLPQLGQFRRGTGLAPLGARLTSL